MPSTTKEEKLLNRHEAANKLGISYRAFARLKPSLIAIGLQEIMVGKSKVYRSSSIDRMIVRAVEKGTPLGEVTE